VQDFKIDALVNACTQFEQGIEISMQNPENALMRDGVIQRFEYTMALSWKLIERYLKVVVAIDTHTIHSRKDLFREVAKWHLIDNAESWFKYYKAGNETSHDYHLDKANEVYEQAKLFLHDVKKLIKKFQELM